MAREITQRELRNDSGTIMRAIDAGESFTVTRNGVPVAQLTPVKRGAFVAKTVVVAALARLEPIDFDRFRADLDAIADPYVQD